jgi:uncharacterized protein YggT (Ycf19 family)
MDYEMFLHVPLITAPVLRPMLLLISPQLGAIDFALLILVY